jgi:hypothetical protein
MNSFDQSLQPAEIETAEREIDAIVYKLSNARRYPQLIRMHHLRCRHW